MVGIRTEVTLVPSGRGLVVRKQRHPMSQGGTDVSDRIGPDPTAITEVEARWLQQAAHHGVVRLRWVSLRRAILETEHAGVATLAARRLPETATAAVLASVCRTLHDLQARRLVHGNLAADHIIVAGGIRPMLCSPRGDAVPTDDLVAMGQIADDLAGRLHGRDDSWTPVIASLLDAGHARAGLNLTQAAAAFDDLASRTRRRRLRPTRALGLQAEALCR